MNVLEAASEVFKMSMVDQRSSSRPKARQRASNDVASPFNDRFGDDDDSMYDSRRPHGTNTSNNLRGPAGSKQTSSSLPTTTSVSSSTPTAPVFETGYRHDISPSSAPAPATTPTSPRRTDTPLSDSMTASASSASGTPRSAPRKIFTFLHKPLGSNVWIHDTTHPSPTPTEPLYFARSQEFGSGTPDVTLHRGADKTGPVLALSHFRHSARHITFGLGDPASSPASPDVQWEEMKRMGSLWGKSRYEFTWSERRAGDGHHAERRRFEWHRTHSSDDGVEGISGRWSIRNYRLTDLDSGEVLAVYLAHDLKSWRKKGELRLYADLGSEIELVVLITCASLSEKLTRD